MRHVPGRAVNLRCQCHDQRCQGALVLASGASGTVSVQLLGGAAAVFLAEETLTQLAQFLADVGVTA